MVERTNPQGRRYRLETWAGIATRITDIETDRHIIVKMRRPEFEKRWTTWVRGALIQKAFPTLDANDREFLITGIMADEWPAMPDDDDEDNA